jgi:hypothetical protein
MFSHARRRGCPARRHDRVAVSRPLLPSTVTADTFVLTAPHGAVPLHVVATEAGRLGLVRPTEPLAAKTEYVLTFAGVTDARGIPLVAAPLRFVTADTPPEPATTPADEEFWVPDADSVKNGWRTNRPKSSWETLQPPSEGLSASSSP